MLLHEDFTLYPIHSDGEHIQHAGHLQLWNTSEVSALALARAMHSSSQCIVGVEVVRCGGFGQPEVPVVTIGLTYQQARYGVGL